MGSPGRREELRERLLAVARADPDITGAAHTGSFALGTDDAWSDVDLALGVRGDLAPVADRWTDLLHASFGAVHHWDLPVGRTLYRVFLLPGWLEVDVAFAPADEFGPRGPAWRLVFGEPAAAVPPAAAGRPDATVGLCWHHVLHAAVALRRGRPWQAEWFLGQGRHHVIELACRRLGLPGAHGRGTDRLPPGVRAAMAATLAGDVSPGTLERALSALTAAFLVEVDAVDPALAARLTAMCGEPPLAAGEAPPPAG